eukprot:5542766-Amphidinium_carterae.1
MGKKGKGKDGKDHGKSDYGKGKSSFLPSGGGKTSSTSSGASQYPPPSQYPHPTYQAEWSWDKASWEAWPEEGEHWPEEENPAGAADVFQAQVQPTEPASENYGLESWWDTFQAASPGPSYDTWVVHILDTAAWEALTTHLEAQNEVYLTLDTACQRTVSGQRYASRLRDYPTRSCEESEAFCFGVGTSTSCERRASCVRLGGVDLSVCYSVVDANIPLLLSRSGLTQLGAVIDLVSHSMICTKLPGTPRLPLQLREGHLTVLVCAGGQEPEISRKADVVLSAQHVVVNPQEVMLNALRDPEHVVGNPQDVMLNALRDPELADAQLKGWPLSQKISPSREYFAATEVLKDYQPRLAPQRTNVAGDSGVSLRSVSMGAYTRRGVGITRITYEQPHILAACHALAATRTGEAAVPYLSVALTRGQSPLHVDGNDGWSTLTGVGKWQRGQLLLQVGSANGQMRPFSIRKRWLRFLASHLHATADYEGDRMSLSYYVPKFPEKLMAHLEELQALGFPVKRWMHLRRPGCLAVQCLPHNEHGCCQRCGCLHARLRCTSCSTPLCLDCGHSTSLCAACQLNVAEFAQQSAPCTVETLSIASHPALAQSTVHSRLFPSDESLRNECVHEPISEECAGVYACRGGISAKSAEMVAFGRSALAPRPAGGRHHPQTLDLAG